MILVTFTFSSGIISLHDSLSELCCWLLAISISLRHLLFAFKKSSNLQAEQYTKQLQEIEEKFHNKAKEIGLIQVELKMIKDFRKKKALLEKELEDVSIISVYWLLKMTIDSLL